MGRSQSGLGNKKGRLVSVGVWDVTGWQLLSPKKCCVYGRSSGERNRCENIGRYLRFICSATQKKLECQVGKGATVGEQSLSETELTPTALGTPRATLANRTFWNDGRFLFYINLVALSYIWLLST